MTKPLHVLIVLPWYKPAVGGVVHGVSRLVEQLPSHNIKVTLLLQQPDEIPTYLGTDNGADIFGFNTRMPVIPGHGLKSIAAFFLLHRRTTTRLYTFMRQHGIDLVNVHYPSAQYQYFRTLRRQYGFPLVVSFHGSDVQFGFQTSLLNRIMYRQLLRGADTITGVGQTLISEAKRKVSGLKSTAVVIPGGAANAYFAAFDKPAEPAEPAERPYILCVARLHPVKGHDTLLKAFRQVKDRDTTNCRLVLAGGGELESSIRSQITQLKLENDVQVAGQVKLDELTRLNRNSIFTVLSSRSEGVPLTIIESFATGRTVVATDVGGVSEIVRDRVTGLLAPNGNEQVLAEKMLWLLTHPQERQQMEKNARQLVSSGFTWEANASAYASIYRSLASGRS